MTTKRLDVVAAITYKDRDGKEQTQFRHCGVAFVINEDKIRVKIDTVPVGTGWDGYFTLLPPRGKGSAEDERSNQRRETPPARYSTPAPKRGNDDFDDDIPF